MKNNFCRRNLIPPFLSNKKSETQSFLEFYTAKGKVIQRIHVFPKEWQLSFKIWAKQHEYNEPSPFIRFQSKDGFKFAFGIGKDGKFYVMIKTQSSNPIRIPANKIVFFREWISVKVNLCSFLGQWTLYWTINDIIQYEHEVQGWTVFTDVTITASKRDGSIGHGKIKEFLFQKSGIKSKSYSSIA